MTFASEVACLFVKTDSNNSKKAHIMRVTEDILSHDNVFNKKSKADWRKWSDVGRMSEQGYVSL